MALRKRNIQKIKASKRTVIKRRKRYKKRNGKGRYALKYDIPAL